MSKELEHLDEKKATGENSMAADPVVGAGGAVKKRRADLKKKVPDGSPETVEKNGVKTPQGSNDVGLKEDSEVEEFSLEEAFEGLFEGTDLSEDFKTKTLAIFEAAVHEKVSAKTAELEEQFENDLAEQVEAAIDELTEKVDSYLDYVVENWMEQNEVAIESNIKIEVAESLLDGIKGLVSEHNIQLDEEGVDALAEVESQLEESNQKYNDLVEEMMALKEEKQKLEIAIVFDEIAEGLTETQADKLSVLAEGVSFKSVADYRKKVEALKESLFVEATAPATDETEFLEEEVEEEAKAPVLDESIKHYVSALDRAFAK